MVFLCVTAIQNGKWTPSAHDEQRIKPPIVTVNGQKSEISEIPETGVWRFDTVVPKKEGANIVFCMSKKCKVWPDGRDGVFYQDGDKKMSIITEMCIGEIQRAILANSIRNWLPPHDKEAISDEKKGEILRAVVEYWQALGKAVVVENREPWCQKFSVKGYRP